MSRLSPRCRKSTPAPDRYVWLLRPTPSGFGLLLLNGTLYRTQAIQFEESDGTPSVLYRLKKQDGAEYQLAPNADRVLACDCPDAVYRDRPTACKHARLLPLALASADRREAELAWAACERGMDAALAELDRVGDEFDALDVLAADPVDAPF